MLASPTRATSPSKPTSFADRYAVRHLETSRFPGRLLAKRFIRAIAAPVTAARTASTCFSFLKPARITVFALLVGVFIAPVSPAFGDELEDATKAFRVGDYDLAYKTAAKGIEADPQRESLYRIEAESLLTLGRYDLALSRLDRALARFPASLRLRLLSREANLFTNNSKAADTRLQQIGALVTSRVALTRTGDTLVAIGEAALMLGVDPRLVMENFFKRAQRETSPVRESFLAMGRLALRKRDRALASRTFQDGLKLFPDDPDLWHGLAASFLDGDRTKLVEYADHAIAVNPHHLPTRLLLAEHLIDAEDYTGAATQLDKVLAVNRRHPDALALRAVLAHLNNNEVAAAGFRADALAHWRDNPHVDHLIGRKLSQKYRFTEGAAAQRRALQTDPHYQSARIQLAQDLLRLGRDDEGWPLVAEVHAADAYDVTAYNLVTLRDELAGFTTLTSPHFRLRMGSNEARIYGDRALALLERAREKLTAKYGLALTEPITVEIYPDPKDFAVRTFGMPDNPGYLGVCFGSVITANSPATQRANWESVLWHEFCHVVTLTLTRNRMPRWLSEGISVYEERQQNPSWGQLMSLHARDRIVEGKMLPLNRMSSAFLEARDSKDLMFAYYHSSLVIEFLVERHGLEKIKTVLRALGQGAAPNDALTQAFGPLDTLDANFKRFAVDKAEKLGGGFDLTRKEGSGVAAMFVQLNPRNFHVRLQEAQKLAAQKDWAGAKKILVELTSTGAYLPGEHNAHAILAKACAALGDTPGERAALLTIASRESDALDAITRLLALAEEEKNWTDTVRWAEAWLAINPLAPTPWRSLLTAHEALAHASVDNMNTGASAGGITSDTARQSAIAAGNTLLQLAPPDLASVHYRVARQLQKVDTAAARRHVLLALAEAPRYRAAYELLADLPASEAAR
jgi:tetratricopeptide (TPR) repeat protein